MEHPSHNDEPITDTNMLQNDFALLELTWQIDLTATPHANSACLPSMSPFLGEDIVSTQLHVGKTAITNFLSNHFRP